MVTPQSETAERPGFAGRTVVALESRRAAEMARLIESFGGQPLVAPSMREVPLEENGPAFAFGEALLAGEVDALICLTGVGTRQLLETLASRWVREAVVAALARTTVVARGPKPVKVLREWAVPVTIAVPEPNTWHEILQALEAEPRGLDLAGARVAVQEYGVPNERFLQGLVERGAQVRRVPVYRWSLPEDLAPLRRAIECLAAGEAATLLFTNATQIHHLLQVAAGMGMEDELRAGLVRTLVASIGPTCSEALQEHGFPVDLEPEHPRMGLLVKAAAERRGEWESGGMGEPARESAAPIPALAHSPLPPGEPQPPRWHDSRFMRACRREPVDATPVWLMRQAGRYMPEYRELRGRVSFLELCKNPDLVAEVTVNAQERIGADAAILFADILLIVEPLGLQLEYTRGDGPAIQPAVRCGADVDRLQEVDAAASLGYVFEAVRRTRAALNVGSPGTELEFAL